MRYIRRYKYIIMPIIFIFIYTIIKSKINIDINLQNLNIVSKISSMLIIFLFIEIGILLNLPKNKFTNAIKELYQRYGYLSICVSIYRILTNYYIYSIINYI